MKFYLILFSLIISILTIGCSPSNEFTNNNISQMIRTSSEVQVSNTESENYVLRIGDKVNLTVWGYPEFNADVQVKENGFISIPLVGDILAAGLTRQQLTEKLKEKLMVYISGEIKLNLDITSIMVQKVTVLGAVNRQDNYTVTTDMTVMEILSTAGGVTLDADLRRIKILRGGIRSQPIEIDLVSLIERGDLTGIPIVKPGDLVYVPKKYNIIRELSEFFRDAIFLLSLFRVFN